ncbi:unnamed protein product [Urochloa humidicola]
MGSFELNRGLLPTEEIHRYILAAIHISTLSKIGWRCALRPATRERSAGAEEERITEPNDELRRPRGALGSGSSRRQARTAHNLSTALHLHRALVDGLCQLFRAKTE